MPSEEVGVVNNYNNEMTFLPSSDQNYQTLQFDKHDTTNPFEQ